MACVEKWSDSQISISSNPMFSLPRLCRDKAYYVNVLSNQTVELGTIKYPFKKLEHAMIEVLNLHSNQDYEVTVNVKEGTVNYIHTEKNYVVNLGKLTLKSYSEDSLEPDKANVVGTDDPSKASVDVVGTMLNVLNDTTLQLTDKLHDSGVLTNSQIQAISSEIWVFHVIHSSILLEGIGLYTEHLNVSSITKFFNLVEPKPSLFEISNCFIDISGGLLYSSVQTNVTLANVVFDVYRQYYLMNIDGFCEDETEIYDAQFIATNITFVYSQPSQRTPATRLFFLTGGGNMFIRNMYSAISPTVYISFFLLHLDQEWTFKDGIPPEVVFDNVTLTSPNGKDNHSGTLRGFGIVAVTDTAPVNITVRLSNIKMYDMKLRYGLSGVQLGDYGDLYITNFTVSNVYMPARGFTFYTQRNVTFENVLFEDVEMGTSPLMSVVLNSLTLTNFTMKNIKGGSASTSSLFDMTYREAMTVTSSSFVDIDYLYSLALIPLYAIDSAGPISLTNCTFSNHYLTSTASLLKLNMMKVSGFR